MTAIQRDGTLSSPTMTFDKSDCGKDPATSTEASDCRFSNASGCVVALVASELESDKSKCLVYQI